MSRAIERLSLVYDARGGVVGELAYAIGRARGTRHCALCGLTHGRVRERLAAVAGGIAPVVVAHTGEDARGETVLLLGPGKLERVGGDLAAFSSALEAARLEAGLDWPSR